MAGDNRDGYRNRSVPLPLSQGGGTVTKKMPARIPSEEKVARALANARARQSTDNHTK